MKTYEIIFIISLLVLVVFLFVFIIVSINNYNKGGVKKYNLFSNFLYELNGFRRYNKLSYTYFGALILLLVLMIMPYFVFFLKGRGDLAYRILILVFSIVSSSSIFALFFVKMSQYKLHLAFDCLLASSNVCLLLVHALFIGLGDRAGFIFSNKTFSILSLILGIVFVIVELALMLNPSYKKWFKMMSVNNDAQSRPKYCYLSVLEFGSLLVYVSSFILLTIAYFA